MRKTVEFLVYLAGVVFFSWNYHKLKAALDLPTLLVFVVFFLFGVSRFATYLSQAMIGRENSE